MLIPSRTLGGNDHYDHDHDHEQQVMVAVVMKEEAVEVGKTC